MRRLTFDPEPRPGIGAGLDAIAETAERVADATTTPDEVGRWLERAVELAGEAGSTTATFEAEPSTPVLDAAARSAGFELVRTMLQLRRSLPVPPERRGAAPADGPLPMRAFRPGVDERAWLDVNGRAFAWHPEQGLWTMSDLLEREAEPWFRPDGFLVLDADAGPGAADSPGPADRNGAIAGFCWTKIHADHDPPLGEIFVIGVDPDRHGHGLGRALTLAGLDWLTAQGLEIGMLYVEADNTAAVGLYRDLGFVEHLAHRWWRRELSEVHQ